MIWRRQSGPALAQDAISSRLRKHPAQRPDASSITQTLTQGDSINPSTRRRRRWIARPGAVTYVVITHDCHRIPAHPSQAVSSTARCATALRISEQGLQLQQCILRDRHRQVTRPVAQTKWQILDQRPLVEQPCVQRLYDTTSASRADDLGCARPGMPAGIAEQLPDDVALHTWTIYGTQRVVMDEARWRSIKSIWCSLRHRPAISRYSTGSRSCRSRIAVPSGKTSCGCNGAGQSECRYAATSATACGKCAVRSRATASPA